MIAVTAPAGALPEMHDRAHDLRNLFGAIASARHLLDDHPTDERKNLLLAAIEEAALRGSALTTRMLMATRDSVQGCFDVGARLRALEPLLHSAAGGGTLTVEAPGTPAFVRGVPERFDHLVLELVENARKALQGSGRIRVRLRARHNKVVLVVADTGCGMDERRFRDPLAATPADGANGRGLQQLHRFARDTHARLAIRSVRGRGTIIRLELPALLGLRG